MKTQDIDKFIPIEGMKEVPEGLPLMLPAWIGLVRYAIGKEEIREQFKKDTGKDLKTLLNRSSFIALIDQTSGYERHLMASFCDWVTVNLWGGGK
jgi:hypothetical protein